MFPIDALLLSVEMTNSTQQNAKLLRLVRLFRLTKLIRIPKSSRLLRQARQVWTKQKLVRFFIILLLASHWLACVWGFVGHNGTELCNANGKAREWKEEPPRGQVSWLNTLFLRDKFTSDDPCNPAHVYFISVHFAIMTITSIGYGDISPVRVEEYSICSLCMLTGGRDLGLHRRRRVQHPVDQRSHQGAVRGQHDAP